MGNPNDRTVGQSAVSELAASMQLVERLTAELAESEEENAMLCAEIIRLRAALDAATPPG